MQKRNDYAPGFIYLIYDPAGPIYKIGLSRSPATRLRYLKQSYGSQLKLLQVAWTFNMLFVEQSLHKQFKLTRKYRGKIDGGTEWFEFDWWVVPYVKACLLGKCWAVNSCYVLAAIALLSLIIILIEEYFK